MPTYEIRHTWKDADATTVVEKVQGAIASAKQGKLPPGFQALSIVALPHNHEAHCLWEAPSREGLEELYRSLSLPTERSIREVTPFYVR